MLISSQVLQMRLDLFARYRLEHGLRIQRDRSGQGAIAVSIATRLGWACCDWIGVLNDMVGHFSGPEGSLRTWGVIKAPLRTPEAFTDAPDAAAVAVDPLLAAEAPARVDEFLLLTLETMSRTFCGLITRGLCLWQGGVYNMVKLLSEDPAIQLETIQRAQLLFPRILALEKLLAATGCPAPVRAFANRFLWFDGVVYRELLCLLSEGHIESAKTYARRVHGTVHHEKGLPMIYLATHPSAPPDHPLPTNPPWFPSFPGGTQWGIQPYSHLTCQPPSPRTPPTITVSFLGHWRNRGYLQIASTPHRQGRRERSDQPRSDVFDVLLGRPGLFP
jgi:hypothetical protein